MLKTKILGTALAITSMLYGGTSDYNKYVVKFKNAEMSANTVQANFDTVIKSVNIDSDRVKYVYKHTIKGFSAKLSEDEVKALRNRDDIQSVKDASKKEYHTNGIQTPVPSWGLDRIDQRTNAYDNTYNYVSGASSVHAYIIDTGIKSSHNEFTGRIGQGHDIVDNDSNPNDCNGHGTHVAGTIGGSSYGVSKDVTLHGVRVLDCQGSGSYADVIAGIDWVIDQGQENSVINMSLGGPSDSDVDTAVQRAVDAGVVVVVAAGNDYGGDACNLSPAGAEAAITVASSNENDALSSFSNTGSCVDIIAPGEDITSAWIGSDNDQHTISGTSMASPHVAGVVATLLAQASNPTPQSITNSLLELGTDNAISGVDTSTANILVHSIISGDTPPSHGDTWSPAYTEHNVDISQELCIEGASTLTVTITGETERNYDFIYVGDDRFSGPLSEEFIVSGSCITARFTTDSSVIRGDGPTVTITQYYNP